MTEQETAPYTEKRTPSEVFVDGVRDALNGTPNASHPVQFTDAYMPPGLVGCTLCGAAVSVHERWQKQHRQNHDDHNKAHDKNLEVALDAADRARTKYYK